MPPYQETAQALQAVRAITASVAASEHLESSIANRILMNQLLLAGTGGNLPVFDS
jgi:hypothetical protein